MSDQVRATLLWLRRLGYTPGPTLPQGNGVTRVYVARKLGVGVMPLEIQADGSYSRLETRLRGRENRMVY